jgi:serine/threonine protein kinase
MVAEGPYAPKEVRRILGEVVAALAAAHEHRIVHRDIRPSNILREDATGRIVLTDFGLAKVLESGDVTGTNLTSPGAVLGDPDHISPEQLRGEAVTEATDIYSVGVLGYELLAGSGPYDASTESGRVRAHLSDEPRLLRDLEGQDPALGALLRRCLAKKPEQRPRASDLATALAHDAGSGAEPDAAPRSAVQSVLDELRRRRVYRVAAAYGAGSYVLLELASNLSLPRPDLTQTVVTAAVLAGLPVVLVLAWMFDFTDRGIVRSTHADGDLTPERRTQLMLLQAVGLVCSLVLAGLIAWWITAS